MKIKLKNEYTFLEWLFILVTSFYIISTIAFEISEETAIFSTISLYLLFGVGSIVTLIQKKCILNPYTICTILFSAFVIIMSNVSYSAMSDSVSYWTITAGIISLIIFGIVVKKPSMIKYLIFAFIIGALILEIRVINEYGGISGILEYISLPGERRIGEEFINSNLLGLFMGTALIFTIIFMFKNKKNSKIKQVSFILLATCFMIMMLLSGSKKSLLFMVLVIGLYIYFATVKSSIIKKFIYLLVILGITIAVYVVIDNVPMFNTINQRLDELIGTVTGNDTQSESDQTRFYMMEEGWNAFMNSPIWGNGTAYSYKLFDTYSHNNFIELLMNYGIIGFLLYYIPMGILIYNLFKIYKGDIMAIGFLIYMILNLVMSVGIVCYYDRPTQIVFALAWAYVVSKKKEKVNIIKENQDKINE